MGIERIKQKLKDFAPQNTLEQELALHEMMQRYVLVALAKEKFFIAAQFQGGTCLRIIHGLDRFSEDLDFVLKEPDKEFVWKHYFKSMTNVFKSDGIDLEILDKTKMNDAVKKMFLKTDSIGKILVAHLPFSRQRDQKITIKLEIDTHPPAHSTYETHFIDFPTPVSITTQTLASSFAGKSHALLCRKYTKGRDWYDFIWYVNKKIVPNFKLLQSALFQMGPWAGQKIALDANMYISLLKDKITTVDWKIAKADVQRFLRIKDRSYLDVWRSDYFLHVLKTLQIYLTPV